MTRRGSGRGRIAIILEHGWVETQAFVREPIVHLAEEGYEIDVVGRPTENWTPIAGVNYMTRQTFRKPATQLLAARLLADGLLQRAYRLVIATPAIPLIYAALLARASRAPLVVLHDELWTARDTGLPPGVRRAMYRAHQRAALTIITDLRRVDVLTAECDGLRSHHFVEFPNAPAGTPNPSRARNDVRADLGVASDDMLVLNAGSLTRRFGLDDALAALPVFPPRSVLVCQSAVRTQLDPAMLALVEGRYPVRFLVDPLPYGEVDDLVNAADIGIALYRGTVPNVRYVGKGSGKLSRYLRAGKPVIVDRNANLEFIADYGAGVVVDDPSQIPRAIERIRSDYEMYASNASRCYNEELAFESHWPGVRAALSDVTRDA